VLASELDVISAAAPKATQAGVDTRLWRVLALCANARMGIENDILGHLGMSLAPDPPDNGQEGKRQLGLAGLTYGAIRPAPIVTQPR
jgi:hypothetical protein